LTQVSLTIHLFIDSITPEHTDTASLLFLSNKLIVGSSAATSWYVQTQPFTLTTIQANITSYLIPTDKSHNNAIYFNYNIF